MGNTTSKSGAILVGTVSRVLRSIPRLRIPLSFIFLIVSLFPICGVLYTLLFNADRFL